jgi:hypothetical protein
VLIPRRAEMLEIFLSNRVAFFFQLFNSRLHINSVPENNRVDHQIEATRFINLLLLKVASELSLIGEMNKLSQTVKLFSLIQLQIDNAAENRS